MHAWSRYWIIGRFTPHFTFSAFRIIPTIPHPFPHFSIPHFTFRIPHFTNDRFRVLNRIIYATADEANAYMFYRCLCFFPFFSVRHKSTRQPFSGTAERIFMKLLPNDSGENGVCIAVPKWGKWGLGPRLIFWGLKTTHCALGANPWRMTEKRLR